MRAFGWCAFRVSLGSFGVLHYLAIQEFITSATTLGALLGGLVASGMSDWTGRRLVLGIVDVIFTGGAIGPYRAERQLCVYIGCAQVHFSGSYLGATMLMAPL